MNWFTRLLGRRPRATVSAGRPLARLCVEELESRWVPSTVSATTSANWSGYAISTNPGAVTAVSGSWTVPTVTGSGTSYSSAWVGIDGSNSLSVEQIGTEMDLVNGQANYYAWYEMYPSAVVTISNLPIQAGDTISASVTYNTTAGDFVLTLADLSTGHSFTTTQNSLNAERSSAEWIMEAPVTSRFGGNHGPSFSPQSSTPGIAEPPFSRSGGTPLANFGSITFTNAQTTINGDTSPIDNDSTAWQNANATVNLINLVNGQTGAVEATTSGLTDSGLSFSVTYGATTASLSLPTSTTIGTVTSLTATGQNLTAVAETAFTETVTTFTDSDSNGTSNLTATIAWGDGSNSTGTVAANAQGGYTVSGTHTYNSSGTFAVNVAIQDSDGHSAVAVSTVTVAAAPPYFTAALAVLQSSEYDTDLVMQDYQQYLGRTPNSSEVTYWVNALEQGTTDVQVLASFLSSPEFYNRAGGTNTGSTNAAWLNALYLDVLGRTADVAGESYWLRQLSAGTSRETIALDFLTSSERDSDFVQGAYQQYLGRPGSTAEIAYWVNLMQQGAGDNQVVADILAAPEYYVRVGNSDKAWVDSLYQNLLHRAADVTEESYWLQVLSAGGV